MYNMEMEGCLSAGGVRKGAWTREEDILLMHCIDKYGEGKWHLVPSRAGLNRCRKSCRLRWMNYLKPDIKRGQFSVDEVDLILRLHKLLGNRWSLIAGRIPGRTANDVKNYWNTHLRKKVVSSYDNIKPKNSANNNNNNNMIDINNQNMIIKSKSSGTVIIKPRPRTFKRQIIPINPKPIAATPTPPNCRQSREEAAPRGPGEGTEQQHYWWESLLDDSARGDEGMIMIGSLLSSTTDDDDIGKLLLVSEADSVGGVANLSSGDHQTTAPLPPLGSPRNEEDDCVWSCMNYSSEFCVEDGLKTCWTDFVLDMDLCDASTDKEMP